MLLNCESEKGQAKRLILCLFTVYLTLLIVVISCFVRMDDFLLIIVYLFYSVRIKLAGSCRALLTCDWTRIAGKVFGETTCIWFIYIVNFTGMYISHFDRIPASFLSFALMKYYESSSYMLLLSAPPHRNSHYSLECCPPYIPHMWNLQYFCEYG